MKALLLTAPSRLEFVDVPEPEVGEDEVLVRVRACGICGSDVHGWDGSSGRRRPPLIMGHEAAGEIAQVGARVTRWRAGERVTFDSTVFCGRCEYCREGRVNLCEDREVIGVAPPEYRRHGAFAEYVAVPERVLYRLPEGVSHEAGAMVEPVAVALHAVSRVALPVGAQVVVVGSGMIGLFVIQVLRHRGVRRIIAVDRAPERLAMAMRLGATDTVLAGTGEERSEIDQMTGGRGAEVAFEVVGAGVTLDLAIAVVRRGGAVVMVGNLAPRVDFALQAVVTRELTLAGTCSSAGEYGEALALIASGRVKVEPMIETVASLAEGAEWMERLSGPDGGRYRKVILQP